MNVYYQLKISTRKIFNFKNQINQKLSKLGFANLKKLPRKEFIDILKLFSIKKKNNLI